MQSTIDKTSFNRKDKPENKTFDIRKFRSPAKLWNDDDFQQPSHTPHR
jgi:hypothetical protein